jgi:predicted NUDIX family NTP pyrophosphohydrolase
MARASAGILVHRRRDRRLEVLLVHPGGPLWSARDLGAWSIPKGEHAPEEDPLAAARREFEEELGSRSPAGEPVDLGQIVQRSGKVVRAWALEGDLDAERIVSNTFTMEWPPRSGRRQEFPEVDRAQWFALDEARRRIVPAQIDLLERLVAHLDGGDRI